MHPLTGATLAGTGLADSTGRRSTGIILLIEELIEYLDRCFLSKRFARRRVHRVSDSGQFLG
jgi:hypothetical protein